MEGDVIIEKIKEQILGKLSEYQGTNMKKLPAEIAEDVYRTLIQHVYGNDDYPFFQNIYYCEATSLITVTSGLQRKRTLGAQPPSIPSPLFTYICIFPRL